MESNGSFIIDTTEAEISTSNNFMRADAEEAYLPDTVSAKQFLDLLGQGEPFSFVTFDDRKKRKDLARQLQGNLDQHLVDLATLNQLGAGVFVRINATDGRGNRAENVQRVRAVFVDLDGADLNPVMAWKLPPHVVVQTSSGRWHAYWLVHDMHLERFHDVQRALADLFGGDKVVNDLGRVMRLPGFMHCKDIPVRVVIHEIRSDLPRYSQVQIEHALGLDLPVAGKLRRVGSQIPCGERNATLTSIAGRLRHAGKDESAIRQSLLKINHERCESPLDEAEIARIAEKVSRYAPPTETTHSGVAATDTGNALRFVQQHGNNLKFVPENGNWMQWCEDHWSPDTTGEVIERAKETAKSLFLDAAETDSDTVRSVMAKHAVQSLNRARLQAMISLASTDKQVVLPVDQLDADDFLLGVRNGVVDLRSGIFRPSERSDFITRRSLSHFDEHADCPTFTRFIERATGGDTELQNYLQRLVGYALTGSTREHVFAFLYGHGANGKSTFLDVVMKLLGDYATQAQPETLMARRGSGASNDLARLVGKRLVITNEVREGAQLEENLVKQLVGGDIVTARFLYQEHFEFKPKLKLLIAGNHQPVIKGDDDGIWRRVHLVPFTHTIPERERDKQLGEKLERELSGILNWAIQGCLAWQTDGLQVPLIISEATRHYREEMDILGNWIAQECTVAPGLRFSSRQLYDCYRKWCEFGGVKPMSSMVFIRKLETRGFRREHTRSGNIIVGIGTKLSAAGLAIAA